MYRTYEKAGTTYHVVDASGLMDFLFGFFGLIYLVTEVVVEFVFRWTGVGVLFDRYFPEGREHEAANAERFGELVRWTLMVACAAVAVYGYALMQRGK